MRKKRVELEQAVIAAAIDYVFHFDNKGIFPDDMNGYSAREWQLRDNLEGAVNELVRSPAVAPITGAGARWVEGSPETSKEAAKLASLAQRSARLDIVALLANVPRTAAPGYTDAQMETRLKRSHQTISSARNFLVNSGWIRDSGLRRKTPSGRAAVVWMLTDAAWQQIKEGEVGS